MKRWHWISLVAVMVGSLVLERVAVHHTSEASLWWIHIPGLYGWLGFLGCIGIIVGGEAAGTEMAAKGRALLRWRVN